MPTKAQVQASINTNLPDNTTGAITPLAERTVANDILDYADHSKSVSSTTSIPFDYPVTVVAPQAVTTNIALTVNNTNAIPGYGATYRLTADGVHTVDISAFKKIGTGNWDNTNGALNILFFMYDGTDYLVSIPSTISSTQLNAPTSFATGSLGSTSVPFTWVDTNTSPNESSLEIQVALTADTTYSSPVSVTNPAADSTSSTVTGLVASTGYRARIKAVGNGTTTSDSSWSTEVTFTTAATSVLPALGWVADFNPAMGVTNQISGSTVPSLSAYSGYSLPSINTGGINGHDTYEYNPADIHSLDLSTTTIGIDYIMGVVYQLDTDAAGGNYLMANNSGLTRSWILPFSNGNTWTYPYSAGQIQLPIPDSNGHSIPVGAISIGVPKAIVYAISGGHQYICIDSVVYQYNGDNPFLQQTYALGSAPYPGGAGSPNCQIARFVLGFGSSYLTSDILAVETYLKNTYAV